MTFQRDRPCGCGIEKRCQMRSVFNPGLNRNRSLPGSRHALFERNRMKDEPRRSVDPKATQTRRSEDRSVACTIRDLPKPCRHVPANLAPLDIGEKPGELGSSAGASGGDPAGAGYTFPNDQHIMSPLPGKEPRKTKPGRHLRRQVLGAVDCDIRFTSEQRLFQLLGKESFPAFILKRPVRLPIPGRRKRYGVYTHPRRTGGQPALNQRGLGQCEQTRTSRKT